MAIVWFKLCTLQDTCKETNHNVVCCSQDWIWSVHLYNTKMTKEHHNTFTFFAGKTSKNSICLTLVALCSPPKKLVVTWWLPCSYGSSSKESRATSRFLLPSRAMNRGPPRNFWPPLHAPPRWLPSAGPPAAHRWGPLCVRETLCNKCHQ